MSILIVLSLNHITHFYQLDSKFIITNLYIHQKMIMFRCEVVLKATETRGCSTETAKLLTVNELTEATNNFDQDKDTRPRWSRNNLQRSFTR
jgi:hypothetical protein